MKILVACDSSQAVTIELRKLGHEAYSCDIIPCSGGHPEWHIQSDVIPLLNGECPFFTDNGKSHYQFGTWDMIIAFPPCTHLAVSGAAWFAEKRTCLWLKGLPLLRPTNVVTPPPRQVLSSGKTMPRWYSNCGGDRPKARAKTFPGIARAMAEQWAGACE